MVADSVREELATKISPGVKSATVEPKEKPVITISPGLQAPVKEIPKEIFIIPETPAVEPVELIVKEPVMKKPQTSPLPAAKPTSPTLVGFNNKNATLPEWRLQMQNAVVKRRGGNEISESPAKPQAVAVSKISQSSQISTNGATALKVQPQEKPAVSANVALSPLERALLRIEESRQKFLLEEEKKAQTANHSSVMQFPVAAQNRRQDQSQSIGQSRPVAQFTAKPNVTSINELKAEKFDTNKLPPIPAKVSSSFGKNPAVYTDLGSDIEDETLVRNTIEETADVTAYEETAIDAPNEEDIDDCAPLGLRFNAAIFDLLIGSFSSLLLLSPFMLLNGKFFSTEGFLAFVATCAIVMFVYMTASIGFLGRTFGMKLFSLEIVDIDENAYPTIHQAAVSSSIYLVSLALGGLGFLTLFLNNEKRAAHDLLSGTIIVKEY